jgi:hypothetical protein
MLVGADITHRGNLVALSNQADRFAGGEHALHGDSVGQIAQRCHRLKPSGW